MWQLGSKLTWFDVDRCVWGRRRVNYGICLLIIDIYSFPLPVTIDSESPRVISYRALAFYGQFNFILCETSTVYVRTNDVESTFFLFIFLFVPTTQDPRGREKLAY